MSDNRELVESLTAAPAQTFCPGLIDELEVEKYEDSGGGGGGRDVGGDDDDLSLDSQSINSESSFSSRSTRSHNSIRGPASESFVDYAHTSDENLVHAQEKEILHRRHEQIISKVANLSVGSDDSPSRRQVMGRSSKKERETRRRRSRRESRARSREESDGIEVEGQKR